MVQQAIEQLREGLRGTPYEGHVYLVGGYVRDKILGRPLPNDLDLVLEGDSLALAQFLYERGIAEHKPVTYSRFGTAMVKVAGTPIELVTARAEAYDPTSRKPVQVEPTSLREDALRRDFTINTLLENLHTGEVIDLLGCALSDLQARLIRTPRPPQETFHEDPLRMLRAVRFAVQLGFTIEPETREAILTEHQRLKIISIERIRDEFTKILRHPNAHEGLQMLLETRLLEVFAQPLLPMVGCIQNRYHRFDVWTHSLKAVECLTQYPDPSPKHALPEWELRLAILLHDVGKPATRFVDEHGEVHFYGHAEKGAHIAQRWLTEMRYPNSTVERITKLVRLHMRPGAYKPEWSDSAIRRLIRDAGELLVPLLRLARADVCAQAPEVQRPDFEELCARIEKVRQAEDARKWQSPLTGKELMAHFGLKPGRLVGQLKHYLEEQVLEGHLAPDDKAHALQMAESYLATLKNRAGEESRS